MPEKAVIVIDWNTSGHHPMYLREYVIAFAEKGIPTVVLSPEPPALDPMPDCVAWHEIPTIAWLKKRQFLGMPFARWLFARRICSIVKRAEAERNLRCERLFFGCFHENQSKLSSRLIQALRLPAAGLYVQAGIFHSGKHLKDCKIRRKVEQLLKQPLLDTIFMLDEGMAETVGKYSGKKIQILPDISDYRTDPDDPLPAKLGLIPKQRPVIGALGHIRPSKGIAELVTFARANPDLDANFLIAGSCRWEEFPPEEEDMIKRAVSEDPRIIFHPERIPEETSYNALVQSCDVLWAAYRNSPHSSNTLAKAAYFRKPVIVADGHLMAKRTRQFGLGIIVRKNDIEAAHQVMVQMLRDPHAWIDSTSPKWAEFCEECSNENFRLRLREWFLGINPASNRQTTPTHSP